MKIPDYISVGELARAAHITYKTAYFHLTRHFPNRLRVQEGNTVRYYFPLRPAVELMQRLYVKPEGWLSPAETAKRLHINPKNLSLLNRFLRMETRPFGKGFIYKEADVDAAYAKSRPRQLTPRSLP